MSRMASASIPLSEPTTVSVNPLPKAPAGRLVALDAFRGATMALMVLVNTPGGPISYRPLNHSEWNGWTITDMVFPSFLWIVGVAITLSLGKKMANGEPKGQMFTQVLKRALIIFVLGLIVYAAPAFSLSTQRIPGVLQRIAVCYLIASVIFLTSNWRAQIAWIFGLLASYWLMMTMIPAPGYAAGDLAQGHNFSNYVDQVLLGRHNYSETKTWDPEGIISTIPSIATALFGIMAGYILRLKRSLAERTSWLYLTGSVLLALGLICDIWLPINKKLWTSSFSLFMAGIDFIVFAGLLWLVDGRGYQRYVRPFVIFGMNAIAVYMASELLEEVMSFIHIGPNHVDLHQLIYLNVFAPLLSPMNASLAFAICYVLLMYGIAWTMYKRGWFLRA
jgi:predicted acyltransferase